MKDEEKTQEQLIQELIDLRRDYVRLSASITEKNRTDEDLKESERKLNSMLQSIKDHIMMLDRSLTIVWANQSMKRDLGDDVVGKKCYEVYCNKKGECNNGDCFASQAFNDEQVHEQEMTYVDKNGEDRHYICTSNVALRDSQNRPEAIIAVKRDITQRKRAEEGLKDSERRYRALFDSSVAGIMIANIETRQFLYANPAICEMLGYTEEEIKQKKVDDIHPVHDLAHVIAEFEAQARGEKKLAPDIPCLRKDGEVIYADITTTKVEIDGKKCNVGFFTDITDRKRTEASLRRNKERFKSFMNSGTDSFVLFDSNLNFIDLNDIAEKTLRLNREDVRGQNVADVIPDVKESGRYDKYLEVLKTGKPFVIKHFTPKTAPELHLEIKAFKAGDDLGLIITDITHHIEHEKSLEKNYSSLQNILEETVNILVKAIETKDPSTFGHQKRMAKIACAIAQKMKLPQKQIDGIKMAGLLHDIGKLNIPTEILHKQPLTDLEKNLIQNHSHLGFDMLRHIKFPWPIAEIILQHHEQYDGSGYPKKLKGTEILLEARILNVANRAEILHIREEQDPKKQWEKALQYISENRGVRYDPDVVDSFIELVTTDGFTI